MATVKEKFKKCLVFVSLFVNGICFFVGSFVVGLNVGCDGYFIFHTDLHLEVHLGFEKWLVRKAFLFKVRLLK